MHGGWLLCDDGARGRPGARSTCARPAKGDDSDSDSDSDSDTDGQTPHRGPDRLSADGGAAHEMDQRHHPHTTTDRPMACVMTDCLLLHRPTN